MNETSKIAKELLANTGYFDLEQDFYKLDYKIAEPAYEKLLWDYAQMFVTGEISLEVFDTICGYFHGSPAHHSLSSCALGVMYSGLELIYYKHVKPDEKELEREIKNIARYVESYLKNQSNPAPEVDFVLKISALDYDKILNQNDYTYVYTSLPFDSKEIYKVYLCLDETLEIIAVIEFYDMNDLSDFDFYQLAHFFDFTLTRDFKDFEKIFEFDRNSILSKELEKLEWC
jgi:hypothetical protein